MFHKIILILLFCNLDLIHSQETCAPSRGNCIFLTDCAVYYNIILNANGVLTPDQRQLISNSWCGTTNGKHKVCCPNTTPTTTTTPRSSTTASSSPVLKNTDYSNHRNINLLNQTYCGNIVDDKISHGNKTEPFQFPWMAIIQYQTNDGIEQLCGGTAISVRYILTAAHCIAFLRGGNRVHSIVLGEHNTDTDEDCNSDDVCTDPIQTIPVENSIPHPLYSRRQFTNDIGLIRLTKDINFNTESVRPICLPVTLAAQNLNFPHIKVTGWGRTENGTTSPILLQADLPIVNNTRCGTLYAKTSVTVIVTHLCAGSELSDSCQGDSGGPAICPGPTRYGPRYIQYGVVSAGINLCGANAGIPGLYTRVTPYMNWILDTMY